MYEKLKNLSIEELEVEIEDIDISIKNLVEEINDIDRHICDLNDKKALIVQKQMNLRALSTCISDLILEKQREGAQ